MAVTLALFWQDIKSIIILQTDFELWCLLSWARNENLSFYLIPTVLSTVSEKPRYSVLSAEWPDEVVE